jgi:5-carboxymethyl-2-hydroxymuconic-semialdehyde dehydrogenase
VTERPAGVAGLITSWRTPFLAQARAVAPALAAGCTAVLKPDERAPLPAALLAEITAAAGLPDGVLNIVHGSLHPRAPGAQARDALILHSTVTRLSFDGDAAERVQVMLDAATHQKNLCVEPASHAPCLIFADADLDQATDSALFGAFALNGQRRTATSTILVERPVYDTLVNRLAQRADRIRVGAASDPATQIGPLPHAEHYDKLTSCVRLGVREGARLVAGGRRASGLPEGNYFAATVLADVAPSMQIFAEPVCGPIVRVTPFDTEEEAVACANAVTQPTAAYIWTSDLQRAHRLAPAIESASTWVNSHNPHDLLTATAGHQPGRPGSEAGHVNIGFYTKTRAMLIAADDTPAPRFGA